MSDYKFVIYEKLDPHAHTDRMLSKEHEKAPEVVTNKQLDSRRVQEKDTIMEDLLEKARTGSAKVLLEKSLNDASEEFGTKHRDSSTSEGNINKLEEKRLAKYNIEKEEYEVASETPKRQRWWEVKGKDGLKIAFKKASFGSNYPDSDYPDFDFNDRKNNRLDDIYDDLDSRYESNFDVDNFDDEFGIDDLDDEFENDDSIEGFDDVELDTDEFEDEDEEQSTDLEEVSHSVVDVGGTPTAIGEISVPNPEMYNDENDPELHKDLEDLMSMSHDDLPFSIGMFDFSRFSNGIITYRVGTQKFNIDEVTASSKSKIVESVKKK